MRFAATLNRKRIRAVLIGSGVVAADQLTKWWARSSLADGETELIDGFLRFYLVENRGSAFSLFQGGGPVLAFAAMAAAAWLVKLAGRAETRLGLTALGLILGGAVGNLTDRIFKAGGSFLGGSVTDFIDFSFWPTFNLADSAITVGVALLLWTHRPAR